jgi:hypothetical protein
MFGVKDHQLQDKISIAYNKLGNCGHLGNQMFQYSCLVACANRMNANAVCPQSSKFSYDCRSHISDCFKLGYAKDGMLQSGSVFSDYGFIFNPKITSLSVDTSWMLEGYFQTEKYFEDCRDIIKNEFTFKQEIIDRSNHTKLNPTDKVAIHIRRDDYLHASNVHPFPGDLYYEKAITYFPNSEFLVISDDIEWCKHSNLFKGSNFSFSGNDPYVDMYLMTECDGHILSNSTFSWWGSWLSESKKQTVAPKRWFGPQGPSDWNDIYNKDWILI